MSGIQMPKESMYEQVEVVRSLNYVEGFDPRKFMRLIQEEGQINKYYLDVAYRKLWFRLKYPDGKIETKMLKLTEQTAVIGAWIYVDHKDPENAFIANGIAQRNVSDDPQFGMHYVELAETAAVGRALSNAGFGSQFVDMEGDIDPMLTEAPIEQNVFQNAKEVITQSTAAPEAVKPAITKEMPVEEIYPLLDQAAAASVVIQMGCHKGKTLGQVALERPGALEWYVNTYNGPDNLLRAASKYLMDHALGQAG